MIKLSPNEEVYTTHTVFNKETGQPVYQETRLGEVKQSPPDDTPATVDFDEDGNQTTLMWFYDDNPHRESGPAVVKIDPRTGVWVWERFLTHGVPRDSSIGPNLVTRDKDSGEVTFSGNYDLRSQPRPLSPKLK